MAKRKSLAAKRASWTPGERAAQRQEQHGLCFRCMQPMGDDAVGEHFQPVALGNDKKPDYLLCKSCSDAKSYGLRGDISTIAKVKRLANANTQYDKREAKGGTRIPGRKMESRGFSTWLKRKFSGEVVKRER